MENILSLAVRRLPATDGACKGLAPKDKKGSIRQGGESSAEFRVGRSIEPTKVAAISSAPSAQSKGSANGVSLLISGRVIFTDIAADPIKQNPSPSVRGRNIVVGLLGEIGSLASSTLLLPATCQEIFVGSSSS